MIIIFRKSLKETNSVKMGVYVSMSETDGRSVKFKSQSNKKMFPLLALCSNKEALSSKVLLGFQQIE